MRLQIAALFAAIGLVATGCGTSSDTAAQAEAEATTTTAAETTEATDDATDETTDATAEDEAAITEPPVPGEGGPGNGEPPEGMPGEPPEGGFEGTGGPAGGGADGMGFETNIDASTVASEEELVNLIGGSTACGNGALDLHRGHQPIEAELIEVLGISHDEMHVRMEEHGQNLAMVADDLGIGAEALEAALVEHLTPAIDGLLDTGTITEEQAAEYADLVDEAIEFRVYWDGEEAPLDFCTAAV